MEQWESEFCERCNKIDRESSGLLALMVGALIGLFMGIGGTIGVYKLLVWMG